MKQARIHLVAGARPNIVKIAPLYRLLQGQSWCDPQFIWFTQHYTPELSSDVLTDFGISTPDSVVDIPPSGFGDRLGAMITRYTQLCEKDRPDFVIVAGDVDTSLGASLAAKRLNIPLVHLEAGLRSYDATMPEETNRILIDSISDVWLSPSEAALQNLVLHEGRSPEQVHFVGNIMIDSLCMMLSDTVQNELLDEFGLRGKEFGIATFHRPANVDTHERASWIVDTLRDISAHHTMVFPLHPRTRKALDILNLLSTLEALPNVVVLPALRYSKFVNLLAQARFILTDSGGVQEESAFLRKLCFTLRETTERPVTLYCGSNHLINQENTKETIITAIDRNNVHTGIEQIPLWDGMTSHRISHILVRWWGGRMCSQQAM